MFANRAVRGSLVAGLLGSLVALGYALATDLARLPGAAEIPYAGVLVAATVVAVPFAVTAGATYLAFGHRVFSPIGLVVAFAALPGVLGWRSDELFVAILVTGSLVVVAGLVESLVRSRLGRLTAPPSPAGYRALSIGVMAAVVYFGTFAIRAALPRWTLEAGTPTTLPPAVGLPIVLWYAFGVSLVLVGLPVAANRCCGLVAPLLVLAAYLLADLAYVQPAVAAGAEPIVVLLVSVWPLLASLLAGVAAIEWWLRARRGEYDRDEGDGKRERPRFSVDDGLFGDRV